jgi:CMP-N,N'-diacetyllegionaminic acid synthase
VSNSNSTLSETLKPFCKWLKLKDSKINTLIILQCTSPLTNKKDILKSIKDFNKYNLDSLFSISESFEHPYETINLKKKKWSYNFKEVLKFKRRQEYKINSYFINGAIYISKISNILKGNSIISKNHGYTIMPKSRSLDIDDKTNMDRFKILVKNIK